MNPKVAKKGRSFKGAAAYYLHDKGAQTSERVVFTHTHNLPTDNAQTAFNVMAYTAMHQNELKAASGQVATGRKATTSVYSYSLSWHPSENPNKDEMIEAAQETLQVLGLTDHEAVFIAHNDTAHPHIHVIINRVHPETGIANTHSCDQLRLSEWAEEYQKQRGQEHFTPERTKNNAKRRQRKRKQKSGETTKSAFVKHDPRENDADHRRGQNDNVKRKFDKRAPDAPTLSPPIPQAPQTTRQSLYAEKEARIAHQRALIKEIYKPKWSALYKEQRAELRAHEKNMKHALYRVAAAIRNRPKGDKAIFLTAVRAFFGKTDMIKANITKPIIDRQESERAALSKEVYQKQKDALARENKVYREQLAELKRLDPAPTTEKQRKDDLEKRVADRTRKRKRTRKPRQRGDDGGRERD